MVKLESHIFEKQVTFDHYIEKQRVAEFFQVIPLALWWRWGYYLFCENIITLYHIPLQEPVKEKKQSKKTLVEGCIVLIGFSSFTITFVLVPTKSQKERAHYPPN